MSSSSELALRVRELGKQYVITTAAARNANLAEAARGALLRPFRRPATETFEALRDVSFDVRRGEIVGVIGKNGAGKSTLLKVLSRITPPSTGHVELYGRIGSLLEVGTGFHRELTGRENIYLNGGILGMSRREIDARFDEIVDFAGTERFLDTPVKRYSSGMYVRLAFAVAAHLRTEVLIVDEVLAVGDDAFQRKCLGKMKDVATDGRTVLFVSHNMQAISTLTQRCLMLKDGTLVADTTPADAIRTYLSDGSASELSYSAPPSPTGPRITGVEIQTSEPNNTHVHGEPLTVRVTIDTPHPIDGARLMVKTLDDMRQQMFYTWTYDSERPMCRTAGRHTVVLHIPRCRLYMGSYTLLLHLFERFGGKRLQDLEGVCPFRVVMHGLQREGGWFPNQGAYIEDAEWEIRSVS